MLVEKQHALSIKGWNSIEDFLKIFLNFRSLFKS